MPPPIAIVQLGVPITLLQNIVYALPPISTIGYAPGVVVLEGSIDGSAAWLGITIAADKSFQTAAPFIRTTTAAGAPIVLKEKR